MTGREDSGPRLTFGIACDCRNPAPWRQPWAQFYADTLDLIARTEDLGFEAVWLPEHHFEDDGYSPSPLTMLGAVAARTSRIKIGPAVSLAPLYHPVRFAEDCALLDILSNGRLEVHIGVGSRERETAGFGVSFKTRGTRTDEFLQIVNRLWAGEAVDHEGKHFSVKNAKIGPTPLKGRVPLYIGGFTSKAVQRALAYGDGISGPIEVCEAYLEALRERGRDPSTARLRTFDIYLYVARDTAQAWEELAPHVLYAHNAYSKMYSEDTPDFDLRPMSYEEFRASGLLRILTPEQAIERFEEMRASTPIEHMMIYAPAGLPPARFADYLELFSREVIPAFR
jgi:alkanesulfonate monooxygenase SsuD/methylene tetrahydromethanopterin reductase-like flavin-dependent oxidoreductase (luciferase family)